MVNEETILTNLMRVLDLTKMALVFWQIVATNILTQVGHYSELSSSAVFTLWRILAGRRINCHPSSSAICGNIGIKGEHAYYMERILMSLFFRAFPDMEQMTTSILPFKTVYYNSIYNKLNLRENKKRKTGGASTLREKPTHNEVEDDEF